jgi:adenylate cyclase
VLINQKFRKKIREKEYEFFFAINGNYALEQINKHPEIDIVLSDISMPEMDGLTLLTKLTETSPLIKSVIVSTYGDMENIRTAMNRGAFDFITEPINFEDLTLIMEKTLKHAQQIKQTIQAIKENNILKIYVDENVLNFMGNRKFESTIMSNEMI